MKREKAKDDNVLLYVPERRHKTWEVRDKTVYLIFYHDKPVEKFLRWLVKKSRVSDIELDAIGSSVWQLIDGKRTVYDIGQGLLAEFGEECQPVYNRLIMFMRYLSRKGWIVFKREEQKTNEIK